MNEKLAIAIEDLMAVIREMRASLDAFLDSIDDVRDRFAEAERILEELKEWEKREARL